MNYVVTAIVAFLVGWCTADIFHAKQLEEVQAAKSWAEQEMVRLRADMAKLRGRL